MSDQPQGLAPWEWERDALWPFVEANPKALSDTDIAVLLALKSFVNTQTRETFVSAARVGDRANGRSERTVRRTWAKAETFGLLNGKRSKGGGRPGGQNPTTVWALTDPATGGHTEEQLGQSLVRATAAARSDGDAQLGQTRPSARTELCPQNFGENFGENSKIGGRESAYSVRANLRAASDEPPPGTPEHRAGAKRPTRTDRRAEALAALPPGAAWLVASVGLANPGKIQRVGSCWGNDPGLVEQVYGWWERKPDAGAGAFLAALDNHFDEDCQPIDFYDGEPLLVLDEDEPF